MVDRLGQIFELETDDQLKQQAMDLIDQTID